MLEKQNPLNLKSMNPWALVSFALIGFIAGYALSEANRASRGALPPSPSPIVQRQQPTPPTPTPPSPLSPPSAATPATPDDDAVLGDPKATVTLIEFSDYQCPFCNRFFTQTLPQLKKEYIETGKVKYVLRDFPLSFHPFAQKASEATECAEEQGKFWEMHDTIFQNQQAIDVPDLKRYATDLGLDATKFNECLDNGTYAAEVQKDFADGSAAGISGTPGFWLVGPDGKGQQISGAQPFANFKAAIDAMLGS